MKKKKKDLSGLRLCGNNLPWVESGKHLGLNLNDKSDCLRYDIKIKRAQYIRQQWKTVRGGQKITLDWQQILRSDFTNTDKVQRCRVQTIPPPSQLITGMRWVKIGAQKLHGEYWKKIYPLSTPSQEYASFAFEKNTTQYSGHNWPP